MSSEKSKNVAGAEANGSEATGSGASGSKRSNGISEKAKVYDSAIRPDGKPGPDWYNDECTEYETEFFLSRAMDEFEASEAKKKVKKESETVNMRAPRNRTKPTKEK